MQAVMLVCIIVLLAAIFGPWFIVLWLNQAEAWDGEKDGTDSSTDRSKS